MSGVRSVSCVLCQRWRRLVGGDAGDAGDAGDVGDARHAGRVVRRGEGAPA